MCFDPKWDFEAGLQGLEVKRGQLHYGHWLHLHILKYQGDASFEKGGHD